MREAAPGGRQAERDEQGSGGQDTTGTVNVV